MSKRWFAAMMAASLAVLLASCQRTAGETPEEHGLFDGSWTLLQIGSEKIPQDGAQEPLLIRFNRIVEEGMETGSIEKMDGQYVMTEKKSGRKYLCDISVLLRNDLVVYTLTFHTPADDPDFGGRDVVYSRVENQ